jgi:hypothetical protein
MKLLRLALTLTALWPLVLASTAVSQEASKPKARPNISVQKSEFCDRANPLYDKNQCQAQPKQAQIKPSKSKDMPAWGSAKSSAGVATGSGRKSASNYSDRPPSSPNWSKRR